MFPKSYKKLMTSEEASQLKDYMRAVVDEGTATILSDSLIPWREKQELQNTA